MVFKVMLVDDEPLAREGLRCMYDWEANGFTVAGEASYGRKALNLLEGEEIDILITDIGMPVMDGLELVRRVNARFPQIKSLFLTCHNDFEFAREALRLGTADYLLKAQLGAEELHATLTGIRNKLLGARPKDLKLKELKTALHVSLTEKFYERAYVELTKYLAQWEEECSPEDVVAQAIEIAQIMHSFGGTEHDFADSVEKIRAFKEGNERKRFLLGMLERLWDHKEIADYYGTLLEKATSYIRLNFSKEMTLEEVARHVGISKNYFSELFRKRMGVTFMEFLTNTRLKEAKALLSTGEYKVYEVAERCGFNDYKHFSKQFKRKLGQSPTDFQGK